MTLPPLLRVFLWPLSLLYGQVTRLRVWLYAKGWLKQKRLGKPVISVGNLTVGGTGKTPMVIWLAERLLAEGNRVGILSRGYKGAGGTSDEIELMKSRLEKTGRGAGVCFGVGADRLEQGKRLEANVDVFVLDDGFQHLALARDLNILLLDASQALTRQTLLPTGRLREPLPAMVRADVLVFTRTGTVAGSSAAIEKLGNFPVFSAATQLVGFRRLGGGADVLSVAEMGDGPFYAFCGIGNPRAFFQDLRNWNLTLADQSEFPDHHRYDARDGREIEEAGRRAGATALMTTEKDAQNLAGVPFVELPVYVAVIEFEIAKAEALLSLVRAKIESRVHEA